MFNCSLLSRTFPSACKRNYCFPPLVQSEEVNSPSFLWQAETVNDWDTTIDRVYCPNYNPVPNQPSLFRLPSWHFGDFLTYFLVHKDSSLIFKNLMCFFFYSIHRILLQILKCIVICVFINFMTPAKVLLSKDDSSVCSETCVHIHKIN